MKKFTYSLNALALGAFLMFSSNSDAATFTAVANGDFSASSTWQGGAAPGNNLMDDEIIIGSGFTVNLDIDVTMDETPLLGTSIFTVDGTLNSSNDSEIIMLGGDFAGSGTVNIGRISFNGLLSTMSFTGEANVNTFESNTPILLAVVGDINVSDSLVLSSGILSVGAGSDFDFETDVVVHVNGGSLTIGGGVLNATNDYDVLYSAAGVTTGDEITGSGLRDLEIDLDSDTEILLMGSNMTVNGDFTQESGSLSLNGFDLTLMGDYTNNSTVALRGNVASNLSLMSSSAMTSDLEFETGFEQIDTLWLAMTNNNNVNLNSDLNVTGALVLESSDLNLDGASTLTMENNSTVMIDQGAITISNGLFEGSNIYNVEYMGAGNVTAGLELSGSGLNNITVMLDDSQDMITLSSDLNIPTSGTLSLENGALDLDGNNLTIVGNFESETSGMIHSDNTSDINIQTTGNLNDTLYFTANGNQMNSLNLMMIGGGIVMIATDVIVGDLDLSSGSVMIFDNNLHIEGSGAISGADDDNYVMTEGDGALMMEVTSGNQTGTFFPIGTMLAYSPATVELNSGTTGNFGVRTHEGVWDAGTFGTDLSLTQSLVDRTWDVTSEAGSSTDIDLTVMWDATMEMNGFDRTDARISHYVNGNWDMSTLGSASTNANGMFQLTRQGITSLSPFAVVDAQSTLSISEEVSPLIAGVYPNPATNNVSVTLDGNYETTLEVLDASGRIIATSVVAGNGVYDLDISSVRPGLFFIRAVSNNESFTTRVVKK